jgi:hypothetical protein
MGHGLIEQAAAARADDLRRSSAGRRLVAGARAERVEGVTSISANRVWWIARLRLRVGASLIRAGGRLSGLELPSPVSVASRRHLALVRAPGLGQTRDRWANP